MAREKRKRRAEQSNEGVKPSAETQKKTDSTDHPRFTAWDYVFVNLFFWVFCWLQRTVAAYLNKDDMGLSFFFYTMALGFTVVSIVAFIHDLLSGEVAKESDL